MKTVVLILQLLASIGLIATVLLQSGKSAGMSGSIAGGMETMFGKNKGMDQLLAKLSAVLAVCFLVLTLAASLF